jgi:L-2-hydroxycarboxylate dehydrogenase (NAD+)
MQMKIEEIRKMCKDMLIKRGIPEHDADLIVEEHVKGELEGKLSHGLLAFPEVIRGIDADGPKEQWVIEKETDSTMIIDGKGNFGIVVGNAAVENTCKKARKEGIAMASMRNIVTFLRPSTLAQVIADKGMIGIVMNTGGAEMVAPDGGIDPVIGTDPIGIAIPTGDKPIVVDMATSKRAWGAISVSRVQKKDLPSETFLDKNGNYAVNPDDAYSAVPFGGYKGFALGMLIEIMTGSLINMPMGIREKKTSPSYRRTLRGSVIIVVDPAFFTDFSGFKNKNSQLIQQVKSSRKRPGVQEILIPGERSGKKREINLKNGVIDVDDSVIKTIKDLN